MGVKVTQQELQMILDGLKPDDEQPECVDTSPIPAAPSKPKTQKETPVRNVCIEWLERLGCDVIRNNTGAVKRQYKTKNGWRESWVKYGKTGSGDILALSPHGRWIEVETKYGSNGLSDDQIARKMKVEALGGVYIVARALEDVREREPDILAEPIWARKV